MLRRYHYFLAMLVLVLAASAGSAQPLDPAGRWALRSGGQVLLLVELSRDDAAPGGWTGTVERPSEMAMASNRVFPSGPVIRRAIRSAASRPDGGLRLEVESAQGTAAIVLRPLTADVAEFGPADAPTLIFPLIRVPDGTALTRGWTDGRAYAVGGDWPSNPEMAAMFEADQAARRNPVDIDWTTVAREDEARRVRTRALLDAGALRSGEDFYHAAFVFQHGGEPDDYLLAHVLATAAMQRGHPEAGWIAAATLDRFLQRVGRPQVFGTQYSSPPGQPTTQEPYARGLLPDSLRFVLGVPGGPEQEQRRQEFEAQARERERRQQQAQPPAPQPPR